MNIKIYSTPTCPWCNVAKKYLSEKKVSYTDYDVSQNHEAAIDMINKSGQRGVPVLDINGNIIVGFDQAKINELLNIH